MMKKEADLTIGSKPALSNIISWLFGIVAMLIGIINIFWGNDSGYGVFIFLLSFIYFSPATAFLKKISGISVSLIVKIILGAFIIWTALGVGELFDKIDLMIADFSR